MSAISRQLILSMLGSDFDNNFICRPSIGASGGILIAWRRRLGTVQDSRVDNHSVSVQFCPATESPWWLTCVYGPQDNQEKIQFLQELRDIRSQCTGPWVVAGDFNLIYKDEDKNNSNLNRAMMGRFRRWINDMAVTELPLHGRKFTWSSSTSSASPMLVNWIGCFAPLIGKRCFLSAFSRARLQMIQTIAHLFLGCGTVLQVRDGFILNLFGPAWLGSWRRLRQRGVQCNPFPALCKRCPRNSKQQLEPSKVGAKRRLAILHLS